MEHPDSLVAGRRVWAVVPAAGRGERFAASGGTPGSAAVLDAPPGDAAAPRAGTPAKQYELLHGVTVLEWSVGRLLAEPRIAGVVVAVARDDRAWDAVRERLAARRDGGGRLHAVEGGASRQASVVNGLVYLESLAAPGDWVLVHDAARPCVAAAELHALFAALDAGAHGAVLAAPVVDTVKRARGGVVETTLDRTHLWRALTPQVFALGALRAALEAAAAAGVTATDESQAMERAGVAAVLVPGSVFNLKVTRREDLATAARILHPESTPMETSVLRIGQGFDAHAFGAGDHVVIGGVQLPHSHGVVAHSDGDVLIHALCDALLGALGEGDIGQHFPDTDPAHRGADSRLFLRALAQRVRDAGYAVVNADLTVLAQAPRIAAHRAAMAANLAADLGIAPGRINVKATTTEHLGFIGRGEGLAAQAAVLLESQARSRT